MTHKKRRATILFGVVALLILLVGGTVEAQKSSPPGRRDPKLFRLNAGGAYSASATAVSVQTVGFTQLTGDFTLTMEYEVETDGSAEGNFIVTATNGDRMEGTFKGTVSPLSWGYMNLSGEWSVQGGTGKYLGASGEGDLTGVIKPLATTTVGTSGILQITMTGEVSIPTT